MPAVAARRVPQLGLDHGGLGSGQPQVGQPVRQPGAPARGVDDEVRLEGAAAGPHHEPAGPAAAQGLNTLAQAEPDRGDGPQPRAHDLLQHRSAGGDGLVGVGGDRHPAVLAEPGQLTGPDRVAAAGQQVVADPGQQGLDGLQATVQQDVRLTALRDAVAGAGVGGQRVPLDHRHVVARASRRRCSQQTGEAGPDHHRPGSVGRFALAHGPILRRPDNAAPRLVRWPGPGRWPGGRAGHRAR